MRRKLRRARELVKARRFVIWMRGQKEKGNLPPGGWVWVPPGIDVDDVVLWMRFYQGWPLRWPPR